MDFVLSFPLSVLVCLYLCLFSCVYVCCVCLLAYVCVCVCVCLFLMLAMRLKRFFSVILYYFHLFCISLQLIPCSFFALSKLVVTLLFLLLSV